MFADDTYLFFSDFNLSNLVKTDNCELDKICYWFKLNKLSLNIKKTKFILSRSSNSLHAEDIVINIDNIKIEQAVSTKFLEVIINQTVSWNEHIQTINPRNTEKGVVTTRCVLQTPYFSARIFQKRFRTHLGYSLSHLSVQNFRKPFAPT